MSSTIHDRRLALSLTVLLFAAPAAAFEIEGGDECIEHVIPRHWTWRAFDEVVNYPDRKPDPESLREGAVPRRAYWVGPTRGDQKYMTISANAMTGDENTEFGVIPLDADIKVRFAFNWKILEDFQWYVARQPRVEAEHTLELKPGYRAEIDLVNQIRMAGEGALSGTAGADEPWPQESFQKVSFFAVDIDGNEHTRRLEAHATAIPVRSVSEASSTSESVSFSTTAGVQMTAKGPSAGGSVTVAGARSIGETLTKGVRMQAVPSQTIGPELHHEAQVRKHLSVQCGEAVTLTRAVQVSAQVYTRNPDYRGSVETHGAYTVSNTLRAEVECVPCGDDGSGRGPRGDRWGEKDEGAESSEPTQGGEKGTTETGDLSPRVHDPPRYIQTGSRLELDGERFGDPTDTSVLLGGQELDIVESSPSRIVVEIPRDVPSLGESTLIITTLEGSTGPLPVEVVRLELEGAGKRLRRGEEATVQVRVRGTRDPVAVRLQNLTPELVRLAGGDDLVVETSGGRRNTATITLTGKSPGRYVLDGRLIQ